jgi:hypothetical protein
VQEQTAVLVKHQGEWVLVVDDDDESERVWTDYAVATADLEQEGWQVAEGPGVIRLAAEGSRQIEVLRYRLRRAIQ